MNARLRIGLSSCFFPADPLRSIFKGKVLEYLEQSMAHWLQSMGVLVYMIPSRATGHDFGGYAEDLDGLVLQGGSDVAPPSYGEVAERPEWSGDRLRDDYEIALVRDFVKQGKPILGICRGLQLLNVAFGGTLYQDVETHAPNALCHRNWEIYDTNHHDLRITENSEMATWYKSPVLLVNSVHHQAIKQLAPDFKVEAISPKDGIIEAVRHSGPSWIFGVQWHPEFQGRDPKLLDDSIILARFLEAIKIRREKPTRAQV